MKTAPIQKELGSVAEVTSGQSAPQDQTAFSDTGRPFIRAGSLESLLNGQPEDSLEHIPDDKAKQFRMRLFPPDTIVFAKSGMSAKIGRVYRLKNPCYVVSHLAAIIPEENLDPGYLQRWLEKNPPSRLIPNDAYPSIRLSAISSLKIPLPPLDEQRRIAAILDKADEVRRKRREAIRLTEELLRSAFLEMFGDPVTNPKGWEWVTIRDMVSDVKYGTSKKANTGKGEYPILRMNNITYDGQLDLTDLKYIDLMESEKEKYLAENGDILFNRTNSKELVGKTTVYNLNYPMAIAGYIIRIRTNELANPYYISAYLNSEHGKLTLINMCKSIVGMANINAQELQDIKILKPPIELQNKYAELVHFAHKIKSKMNNYFINTTDLFNSLVQRAFKGEL